MIRHSVRDEKVPGPRQEVLVPNGHTRKGPPVPGGRPTLSSRTRVTLALVGPLGFSTSCFPTGLPGTREGVGWSQTVDRNVPVLRPNFWGPVTRTFTQPPTSPSLRVTKGSSHRSGGSPSNERHRVSPLLLLSPTVLPVPLPLSVLPRNKGSFVITMFTDNITITYSIYHVILI